MHREDPAFGVVPKQLGGFARGARLGGLYVQACVVPGLPVYTYVICLCLFRGPLLKGATKKSYE